MINSVKCCYTVDFGYSCLKFKFKFHIRKGQKWKVYVRPYSHIPTNPILSMGSFTAEKWFLIRISVDKKYFSRKGYIERAILDIMEWLLVFHCEIPHQS